MFALVFVLAALVAGVAGAALAGRRATGPAPATATATATELERAVMRPPDHGAFLRRWALVTAICAPVVFLAAFRLVRRGMVIEAGPDGLRIGGLVRDRRVPYGDINGDWELERRVATGLTFDRVRYFRLTGGRARVSQLLQQNAGDLIDAIEARAPARR